MEMTQINIKIDGDPPYRVLLWNPDGEYQGEMLFDKIMVEDEDLSEIYRQYIETDDHNYER